MNTITLKSKPKFIVTRQENFNGYLIKNTDKNKIIDRYFDPREAEFKCQFYNEGILNDNIFTRFLSKVISK